MVKAVDEVASRKRKADKMTGVNSPSSVKTGGSGSSSVGGDQYQLGMLPPEIPGNIDNIHTMTTMTPFHCYSSISDHPVRGRGRLGSMLHVSHIVSVYKIVLSTWCREHS